MINSRIQKSISALPLLLMLLTAGGCEQSEKPEPEADYSKEGPNGPDAQTEFTTTESGLKYKILREGTGKKPTASDAVRVSYRGWLDEGEEFDSSYARETTVDFLLKDVIPAWTEGLQYVGEGGKIELSIPPELGYGAAGKPPKIPPNAQLHFIVEVHDVSD